MTEESSVASTTASAAFVSFATADVTGAFLDSGTSKAVPDKAMLDKAMPLADMRLAVKDLFHIQGIATAAGNPTWLATHAIPQSTNSSVAKLICSGARYVGKTLTDELAYSLNGQNIHYPTLVNPINPERMVGGSSSGSAAAVASNMADIGLGTDTGGSIRVPASYNGLYGLRTTHGAIACDNMVALAPSFDTVGWMCTNLDLLEKVAKALLPEETINAIKNKSVSDRLSEPRLFVANNLVDASEQGSLIQNWLGKLSYASITKSRFDADGMGTSETFRILQGHEIWQQHGAWITEHSPHFADDVSQRFTWCKSLGVEQQAEARTKQKQIIQCLDEIFENHDLMLVPTTPGRAPLLKQTASAMARYREDLMAITAIAGLSGRPQIHLPLFTIDDAPCGLSLIGNKGEDLDLIRLARELLKVSKSSELGSQIQ